MPKVSDTWKPGFSAAASVKAFSTGNYADGVLNAGLAVGQAMYAVGKYKFGDKGRFAARFVDGETAKVAFGAECVILERGIQVVTLMNLLHGSGKDGGQYYEQGSTELKLAWESLKDAAVDDDYWSGAAADAYDAKNDQQMGWVTTVADLDLAVAAIIAKEADALGYAKIALTSVRTFFTLCIPIASALRWMYPPPVSQNFQIAMVTLGLIPALGTTLTSLGLASRNAGELALLYPQYEEVAAGAVITGSEEVEAKLAPAPRTVVGQFDELDTTGSSDDLGSAGSSGTGQDTSASAATGTLQAPGETPGDYSQGEPAERAVPQPGFSPASAASALGQVPSRASGARAPSAPASPAGAAGAKAPAREAAAVEEDTRANEPEGAATGAGDGERAPIDAAAGRAEQVQERVR